MPYTLVLACDLTPCGTMLGPVSTARLTYAVRYARHTGDHLVVAAGRSPRHPSQSKTVAEMMAEWLKEQGIEPVVLRAPIFNTRGELIAFFELGPEALGVISDELHLRRVRILVHRMKGREWDRRMTYIPTHMPAMTRKGVLLEPLKRAFVRLCPFWIQDVVPWLLHRTPLRHINLSH